MSHKLVSEIPVGTGGMGSIARRVGPGHVIVLADVNKSCLRVDP
jgi:hypothetical protein